MRAIIGAGLVLLFGTAQAGAQQMRDLCPTRPGLGISACTVDPGHVVVEAGLADWTRDRQPDTTEDTILAGDLLARVGIGPSSEIQLGLTSYGHVRTADRASGAVMRQGRVGDATIAFRQNLANPDGSGLSVAVQPFATLPVGRQPVGAGTWGAGVIAAIDYELTDMIQLQLTPEIEAAPNEDGAGRHLAYSGIVGVDVHLTERSEIDLELSAKRDRDPGEHATLLLAAASYAWQPADDWQLDVGSAFGLNHASPDVRVYGGVVRRF